MDKDAVHHSTEGAKVFELPVICKSHFQSTVIAAKVFYRVILPTYFHTLQQKPPSIFKTLVQAEMVKQRKTSAKIGKTSVMIGKNIGQDRQKPWWSQYFNIHNISKSDSWQKKLEPW